MGRIEEIDANAPAVWGLAVVLFGVGDLVTTALGYPLAGVTEGGPVSGPLLERYGVVALFALKTLALGVGYLACRRVPRPQSVGSPLAFAVVGLLVTAWNLVVLVTAG